MSNFLNSIPADKQHDWKLFVDGQEVSFEHVKVSNEKFGVSFEVGLRPEGFPGPAFYEKGGAITILYSFTDSGELLIGLLSKKRPNLSSHPLLEAVGGMVDPGEKVDQTQARETQEEAGVTWKAEAIPGMATWNRLYQFADLDGGEEGVKRYIVQTPFTYLQKRDDGSYVFSQEAIDEYGVSENIRFLSWEQACFTPDTIAASGIACLLSTLGQRGEF